MPDPTIEEMVQAKLDNIDAAIAAVPVGDPNNVLDFLNEQRALAQAQMDEITG